MTKTTEFCGSCHVPWVQAAGTFCQVPEMHGPTGPVLKMPEKSDDDGWNWPTVVVFLGLLAFVAFIVWMVWG